MIITSHRKITLIMSEEEASHLLEVTYHISGEPDGPRGSLDMIHDGLINAGVARSHDPNSPNVSGYITLDATT